MEWDNSSNGPKGSFARNVCEGDIPFRAGDDLCFYSEVLCLLLLRGPRVV